METDKEAARNKYLNQIDSKHNHDFVIKIKKNDGEISIGIAQVWSYVEHRHSWELGFGMLPDYQSNGYGYDAVKLVVQYTFQELNARKIVGMCNRNNLKSIKLMEKLNMSREGIFKEELKWNGEYHDQYFYSILKREWEVNNMD
ncbi:GNAT family N-acetyltransferase [Paenibacillus sp. CAU 1782]